MYIYIHIATDGWMDGWISVAYRISLRSSSAPPIAASSGVPSRRKPLECSAARRYHQHHLEKQGVHQRKMLVYPGVNVQKDVENQWFPRK